MCLSYGLKIGTWKSWAHNKLDIRDIVWPGNSHAPPQVRLKKWGNMHTQERIFDAK